MTTFEPCGFRALRTGTMVSSLETARDFGARNAKGRRMNDNEFATYVAENFELIYRVIPPASSSSPS